MANVVCPSCGGSKGGFRLACGSLGCQSSTFVCEFCKGEGQVSAEADSPRVCSSRPREFGRGSTYLEVIG